MIMQIVGVYLSFLKEEFKDLYFWFVLYHYILEWKSYKVLMYLYWHVENNPPMFLNFFYFMNYLIIHFTIYYIYELFLFSQGLVKH